MAIIIAIVFGYLRVSVIYRNQFHRVFHREGTHRTNISYLRPPPVAFSFSLLAHPAFPALRPSPLNLDHATNEGHVRSPPRIRAQPFSRSSSYDSLPLSMPLSFSLSLTHTHTHPPSFVLPSRTRIYIYRYTRACAIIRTHSTEWPFYSPRSTAAVSTAFFLISLVCTEIEFSQRLR